MVTWPRAWWYPIMIECRPIGICSWDFELRGEGCFATLGFGWPREHGWINLEGRSLEIQKQSFFAGSWHLLDGAEVRARAEKRSAFSRSFDLITSSGSYILEAEFFGTRTMRLQGPNTHARITPAHMFTRRAVIEGTLPDFETLAFAFWLTALTWRRAARNNNAGSS